jgi:hypothetical protein
LGPIPNPQSPFKSSLFFFKLLYYNFIKFGRRLY